MAFDNGDTVTANSKKNETKVQNTSSKQLAVFIRQLERFQIELIKNLKPLNKYH